jgi:hypothetical protein
MPTRPYPYTPGSYKAATGKQSGLEEFSYLSRRRWRFRNLGTWVVRMMNGKPYLSVHSTGNCCDLGYSATAKGRQTALEACRWYARPDIAPVLGIVAIHDYAANPPRAWRCDRDAWQGFANGELGAGGHWLHVELDPARGSLSAKAYRALWKSLPKP